MATLAVLAEHFMNQVTDTYSKATEELNNLDVFIIGNNLIATCCGRTGAKVLDMMEG